MPHFLLFCLLGALLAACASAPTTDPASSRSFATAPASTDAPTPLPIKQLTPTQSPQPTWTPTSTPSPTPSPIPSPTPTANPLEALRLSRLDDYTAIRPVSHLDLQTPSWSAYTFDPADARCIFGAQFSVLARPGRDPTKTVFWMNGGGACWPGQEACANHFDLSPWASENKLASQDERNPLRDWNFVFVPSCDGSFFMGDHQADYSGDGQVDHTHWGLRNTSAAVGLMRELFPASQKILVAGCSAGGYGTLLAGPLIRLQYPEEQLYVFNESGPGLFNPSETDTWASLLEAWGLEPLLPAGCPRCRSQLIYLYPWMLERDPNLHIGLYSSYRDAVIGSIYLEMTPPAFETLLMSATNEIHAEYPEEFKRFFVAGSSHCVADYFYAVNGVNVYDWIEALVTDDPAWVDIVEDR